MIRRWINYLVAIAICLMFIGDVVLAAPKIVDYQSRLPRKFKKRKRLSTRFLIVHSTEAGLQSSLRTLSRRGHANYLIARNGVIYRILNKRYRANHAGRSMWNGLEDISSHSIGIELVGYHNDPFTKSQYESLKWLINTFQKQYKIPDRHVLEHYRVAYGKPNRYIKKSHRGRKKDPGIFNFDRKRAGLTSKDKRNSILYDPDVAKRRLIADPDINIAQLKRKNKKMYQEQVAAVTSDIITAQNTAWRIARGDYDNPTTIYRFPNGKILRGNQVKNWSKIPVGTKVTLNSEEPVTRRKGVIKQIAEGLTAYDLVGMAYRRSDTYYIFPKGTVKNGKQVKGWSRIPPGTWVIAKYNKPVALNSKSRKNKSTRNAAKDDRTVFLIPKSRLVTASEIKDVTKIPSGTLMFVKK